MTGSSIEDAARVGICDYGRELYRAGFIAGTAGNLSTRLDEEYVLVTPRGEHKGRLDPTQIVRVPLQGDPGPLLEQAVTSEFPLHRACYLANDLVRAVIHSHAPALTAAGIRGLNVTRSLPDVEAEMGRFERVKFAPSGSEELGEAAAEAVQRGAKVLMLEKHGVVTVGSSLEEAFEAMELAELAARAVLLAQK
jgi:L-fuculose-phosphate aldolase